MESAKQAVQNLLGRGDRHHDETTTGSTANSSATGQSHVEHGDKQYTGSGITGDLPQTHQSGTAQQFDSGSHSTGTALGGRTAGNVADTALHSGSGSYGISTSAGTGTGVGASAGSGAGAGAGTGTGLSGDVPVTYHQVTSEGGRADSGLTGTGTGLTETSTSSTLTGDRTAAGHGTSDTTTGYGDSQRGLVGTGTGLTGSSTSSTLTGDRTSTGHGLSGTQSSTTGNAPGLDDRTTGLDTVGSSETHPQTASVSTRSSQPGVATGDTFPQSGDLKSHTRNDSGYQDESTHQSRRKDPAVVEESKSKLTGTGEDGSHSAVFGLTPDGHKYDDTAHGHGQLQPAHSKHVSNTTVPEPTPKTSTGDSVAEQMRDPRVGESGDGRPATYTTSTNKPGAGS